MKVFAKTTKTRAHDPKLIFWKFFFSIFSTVFEHNSSFLSRSHSDILSFSHSSHSHSLILSLSHSLNAPLSSVRRSRFFRGAGGVQIFFWTPPTRKEGVGQLFPRKNTSQNIFRAREGGSGRGVGPLASVSSGGRVDHHTHTTHPLGPDP